jgi:hypothetical protein
MTINYETLLPNRSTQAKAEIISRSIKLKPYNNNYAQVISSDANGYILASFDENGNETKRQTCQWRNRAKNKMVDYKSFEDGINAKKAQSKFLSIEIGGSATYELASLKASTQVSNFSGEMEDCWIAVLNGVDPKFPDEKKNWTITSLAVINQFREQNIQDGDKILIERIAKGDKKSTYKIKKLEK